MDELRSVDRIGQHLRQRREARRISVAQAANVLHIRMRYVEAMEAGTFDAFPSPAQARGFLGSYAQYLGLPLEPLLAALDGDVSLLEEAGSPPEGVGAPGQVVNASDDVRSGSENQPAQVGSATEGAKRDSSAYLNAKFREIGEKLRIQRETLGLSLEDVERQTRVRAFYLKALEAGDLEGLPSPVQGRGMLKNYASFLGLDSETLLLLFAEGLQASLASRQGPRLLRRSRLAPSTTPLGSPPPRLITIDLLLAGVLVMFLIAFIAWGVIRISSMRASQAPTATAPAIVDVLAQVGTPTLDGLTLTGNLSTPTGIAPTVEEGVGEIVPQASATPPPEFSSASVQVIISVRLRSWMRVTVDGKVAFEGRALPGSAFSFAGDDRVEILTGNGAGLAVNFNQVDMGTLGLIGEAVQRVFTVQGMQTPTPTITRTPAPATITPTLTPTP